MGRGFLQTTQHGLDGRRFGPAAMRFFLERDAGSCEGFDQRIRLGLRPIQDGEIGKGSRLDLRRVHAAAVQREKRRTADRALDRVDHELCFRPLGGTRVDRDAVCVLRQRLQHAVGDQGTGSDRLQGRRDDRLRRTVVPRESDNSGCREVPRELEKDRRIRTAEAVDRLVRVADRTQVAVGRDQMAEQAVLVVVQVLVLVDREPRPATAILGGDRGLTL